MTSGIGLDKEFPTIYDLIAEKVVRETLYQTIVRGATTISEDVKAAFQETLGKDQNSDLKV